MICIDLYISTYNIDPTCPVIPSISCLYKGQGASHLSNAIIPPSRRPSIQDSLTGGDNQLPIVTTDLMLHSSLLCYFNFETGKLRKNVDFLCALYQLIFGKE